MIQPNRLAKETSPYLRQHQDNPVDWYPWGEEALERAAAEDRPILLSVGYSACHWCHVMAHESFEDPDVAAVMNELFVNVKVDREERPDVDAVYMEAVQAFSGQGGWPMTVFLTPDGRPFFGGTYYPKTAKMGRPGFVDLMRGVDQAWHQRRDQVLDQADHVSSAIEAQAALVTEGEGGGQLDPSLLERAYETLAASHDPEWGGFGRAPKFPMPTNVELMLRTHARTGADEPLRMALTTLDAMASGGMYDHLGGGFHRYSVDNFWMVPHFEKMLYDQAGLARAYLHAWQVTGEARFRQVAEETVGYAMRELRQPEGGFSSAEDADSEGEEGRFYVWCLSDVVEVGGPEAVEWYGGTKGGNFEGANILHRPVRGDLLRPPEVEAARRRLLEAREERVRPGLDDKVLTEWNAMFLSSLAEGAAALGREDWLEAAVDTGSFLLSALRREDGRWLRSWQRDGGARHLAYAVDHAWLVDAFCRLAEASGAARWIAEARRAADSLIELFWDADGAGFFTTGHDAERLVVRHKDLVDGATPSANSVAATALLRLAALTGEQRYAHHGQSVVRLLSTPLNRQPAAFGHLLGAVDMLVTGTTEIAVVGERPDLVSAVHSRYLPNAVLAWGEPYDSPLWQGRSDGLAYVCRGYSCKAPVSAAEDLDFS
ncbi:MAG: thioredoxin domain-containing protein [Actinomycetota bacterium]|nr:thioredoxin domain-containing protein [Actinomycetota bacterium]MDQ3681027.1 thioredoxin domain-containing protein [Actinomycetota bacterium]